MMEKKLVNIGIVLFHSAFFLNVLRQNIPLLLDNYILNFLSIMFQCIPIIISIFVLYHNKDRLCFSLKSGKLLMIGVVCYILIDILNCSVAIYPLYAFGKYPFIIRSLVSAINVFAYVLILDTNNGTRRVFMNIGISGIVITIISYILYYNLSEYTVLDKRISTSNAYNDYCNIILMSLIALIIIVIFSKFSFTKKIMLICAILILEVPAIYLSTSKRGYLMFIIFCVATLVIALIMSIYNAIREKDYKKTSKKILVTSIFLIIAVMCINFQIEGFYKFNIVNEDVISSKMGLSMDERLESQGLMADISRTSIWTVAINNIKHMNAKQIIFGGGGSYSSDIFDKLEGENADIIFAIWPKERVTIHWLDPHNIFLNDFLEGGIIKLSILIFVIIVIMKNLIYLYHIEKSHSIILFCYFLLLMGNLFVSAHYGALYNRWTLILIAILLSERIKRGSLKW